MITKTDAVVLKSMRYGDSSKIVTFYTRRFGKIKGIAKGARLVKSKFGASLEPLTVASVVLYKKEHRDLHLISQCDILRRFKYIDEAFEKLESALAVVELVQKLAHEEEENYGLYTLLVDTLDAIDRAEQNALNLLHAFEVRLAALFGYGLSFERCLRCGQILRFGLSAQHLVFDLGKGGLMCQECVRSTARTELPSPSKVLVTVQTAKVLEQLSTAHMENIVSLDYNNLSGNEVDETLRLYLRYHFEGLLRLKSADVFQRMNS